MKKLALLATLAASLLNGQEADDKMQWFADAKLGIFIHWGIYSVNGIAESWSFFNEYTPYENYRRQLSGFTANQYQPEEWAQMIRQSGARYAVITSKHHDGVALWDTKAPGSLSVPLHAAAKKDVLTPFVNALKQEGLKTGIYFSLPDWSHTDYDVFTRTTKRYDYKAEPRRFEKFVRYYQSQLKELSNLYNPDLYWFDGDWEHTAEEWKAADTRQMLLQRNLKAIINARLANNGDYETPEQGIPVKAPKADYWELCYTMNDSWGYQQDDKNYKPANQIIKTLVECISMGGNLLLDIGPKADGTIPAEQQHILQELGRWTNKHQEAVYGTTRGISQDYFSGKSALSKDRKSLFLYLSDTQNGQAWLRGIESRVKSVTLVGSGQKLTFSQNREDVWIDFPESAADPDVTVLRVDFNEVLKTGPVVISSLEGTSTQQIKQLAYAAGMGQNPFQKGDISINGPSKIRLNDAKVTSWLMKHAEVFENPLQKGLSDGRYAGMSTLSADGRTLYLFVDGNTNGNLMVKGLMNSIQRVRIVGDGAILSYKIYDKLFWSEVPGLVTIEVPRHRQDETMTVIALMLDAPLKEYDKEIKAVESN